MKMMTTQYGSLRARVLDSDASKAPEVMVILCHGFGAPGTDLVGLAEELRVAMGADAPATRFIFPEAPLDLSDLGMWGARAWWHIDMAALQRALASGVPRALGADEPEGLGAARKALTQLIDLALTQAKLPMARLVLGGFSQGAMLATDVTLRLPEAPGHLAVLSGALLAEKVWAELAPRRVGMRATIAHGHEDPILPFRDSEALRDLLVGAGWNVEFQSFRGGHTIDRKTITHLSAVIRQLAAQGL